MKTMIPLVLALGVTAACRSAPEPQTSARPTAIDESATAMRESPTAELDVKPRPPGPVASKLLAASNRLSADPVSPAHTRLVGALERLADALEVLVPDRVDEIRRVRASAATLARTPGSTVAEAVQARAGLQAAVSALEHASVPAGVDPRSSHALRLQEARQAAANAVAALAVDHSLADQYDLVRIAVRESTRAVYAAMLAPEPNVVVATQ